MDSAADVQGTRLETLQVAPKATNSVIHQYIGEVAPCQRVKMSTFWPKSWAWPIYQISAPTAA
eukprot:9527836-Prorocentrum_lima.AAC.1